MRLVENAKNAWRWISVQCMVVAGAIQGAWLAVPPSMQAAIPANVVYWCTLALLALGVAGRLVKQEPPACPAPPLPVIDPALIPPDEPK